MSNVLEHIVILASNLDYNNDYDCPIDKSYVDKMLHQLKQTMVCSSYINEYILIYL